MSYILEALKKSDEERNRGTAPGLQTVQSAGIPAAKKRSGRHYLITFALLLNAALLGWRFGPWDNAHRQPIPADAPNPSPPLAAQTVTSLDGDPARAADRSDSHGEAEMGAADQPEREVRSIPAQAEVAPVAASSVAAAGKIDGPAPAASAPIQQPSRPAAKGPAATVRESKGPPGSAQNQEKGVKPFVSAAPKTAVKPEAGTAAKADPAPRQQADPTTAVAALKPEGARVATAPADAAVPPKELPNLQSLPPAIRKALPSLTLSLLVYSHRAADRMVNINGQMRREGQEIAPGLVLEEITREGAVFNYQGTRFQKGAF